MPRKKKDDLFQKLINKALEKIEGFIDKLTVKDAVYLASYISAVYIAYWICQIGNAFMDILSFEHWVYLVQRGFYKKPDGTTMKLSQTCLAMSMVAAYMTLKLDISDITSAVSTIRNMKVTDIGQK